ncbi:MAG: YqcC family protein [Gammaproteobacteria bacterium]|nr:YqcC family protein [Gammaproteobacteria bacterium]
MQNRYDQIYLLSVDIEKEMRTLRQWEGGVPGTEALSSELPFCYDTLMFNQWLQWIFLPRIRAVVEGEAPLPEKSEIAPMAEIWVEEQNIASPGYRLLELIREMDRQITDAQSTPLRLM